MELLLQDGAVQLDGWLVHIIKEVFKILNSYENMDNNIFSKMN